MVNSHMKKDRCQIYVKTFNFFSNLKGKLKQTPNVLHLKIINFVNINC